MDVADLNIRARADGVDRANRSLNNLSRTSRKTETATQRLNRENQRALRRYRDMQGGINSVVGTMRTLIGVLGVTIGVREIIQLSDAWRQINNQLKQVTGSESELRVVRERLMGITRATNSDLESTISLYSELYRSTRDLGVTQKEVADVTRTINNLFLAGGKSAAETAGAVRQLAQGFAAGALRGDEFNSVAEGAPRIMDALAQALNMGRGELREFAAEGGITAQIMIEALRDYSDEAQKMADMTERTFDQHMTNADTNMTQFFGQLKAADSGVSQLGKLIEDMTGGLLLFTDEINDYFDAVTTRFLKAIALVSEMMDLLAGRDGLGQTLSDIQDRFADIDRERALRQVSRDLDRLLDNTELYGFVSEEAAGSAAKAAKETEEFKINAKDLSDTLGNEVIGEVEELARRFADVRDEIFPQQAAIRELMLDYDSLMTFAPGMRDAFLDAFVKIDTSIRQSGIKPVKDLQDAADPLAESWQEALNRIDTAFEDLWKSTFRGFEDFSDTLEDAFIQLLASLAHRATTQPILIAMGLDYGNGGNSQSGGLDDVMSLASFANALDSTPLAQIGDIIQEIGFNTGSRGIFDAGADLQNLTAKDIGLSALAGYAGSFIGNAAGEAIFNKEAESSYGAAAGGVIGGYIGAGAAIGGPWGAAIGAAIGALIDVFGGGDGKERVSLGVLAEHNARNNPNLDDVLGQSLTTASGLELSTYTKRIGEEGIAVAETMLQGMAAADAAITNIFSVLTEANQAGALAGETLRGGRPAGADTSWPDTFFGSAEFNEVNEAALAGATDQFIRSLVDRMNEVTNAGIDLQPIFDLQREGELLADVLLRVSNNFQPVNNTLEALGLTMYDLSTTGMAAADSLAQMFGGLEQFNTATSRYYQLFLTEQERLEHTAAQVESVFGSLNVTMPDTVSGFRDIVEGLDVTTTQGQATFATLMRIAPAFHEVATASQQAADDITDAAEQIFSSGQRNTIRDIAGTIFQTYEDREKKIAELQSRLAVVDSDIADVYRRMDDAMSPAIDTVETVTASIDNMGISASQLRSVADNILGLVDRLKLGELSPLTNVQQLQEARSQFEQARQAAEAGDASGLGSAAQSYLEQASTYFASSPAYVGIFNDVTRYLESMGTELDTQATAAERAERAREAQMQRLEAINQETANAANLAEYYGEIDRLMQEKQLIEQQLANLTATDSRVILDRQLQSLIDLNSGIQDMAHLLNVLPSGLALEIATVLGVSAIGGINLPGAANGGIANGPASGYPVMLHGREMITPLDGTEVKVDNREVVEELRSTNDRLDRLENRLSEGNQQRGEGNRDRKGIRREVNRPSARTPGVTA